MDIIPLSAADPVAHAGLLDICFGPARAGRTAALLRRGANRIGDASLACTDGGMLVGSVEVHGLALLLAQGQQLPIAWLGPLVSHPERRGEGIGVRLMAAALAALDARDIAVALIGDAPYYTRWGFSADHTGSWILPGPVDRSRLLLRSNRPARFAGAGHFLPAPMQRAA